MHHPHVIEEFLCEPLFEEMHFHNHPQHSFDTTWDLTPPESPVRGGDDKNIYDGDYSRITVNLEQCDFSASDEDLASIMWNNGGGAFEIRGEWTAPPSPVEFGDLTDICNDVDSYPTFELEDEEAILAQPSQIPFNEPSQIVKRKTAAFGVPAPAKLICKTKGGASGNLSKPAAARQRLARQSEISPSPSMESDDPESKRHTHNVLERKRRNELKSSYQELREEIPDLNDNDKTPTGVILNRACEYIAALQEEEAVLLQSIAAAKAENARLRKLYA